jgi:hypothetical protein
VPKTLVAPWEAPAGSAFSTFDVSMSLASIARVRGYGRRASCDGCRHSDGAGCGRQVLFGPDDLAVCC